MEEDVGGGEVARGGGGETDLLLSSERLSNDSPVMWPDQQHFCNDITFCLLHIHSLCLPLQLVTSIHWWVCLFLNFFLLILFL